MNLFEMPNTTSESPLLEGMNEQQALAINQTKGPLLILAGAGSGKTRVVTHRIAYLIEEKNVAPWNILAITFTNKAAREMKERTSKLTPNGRDVWISTFHSMCVSILRRHIQALGYNTNFAILDDADQIAAIKQILKKLNIDSKIRPPKYYAARISEVKNQMLPPEEVTPDRYVQDNFIDVYKNYQSLLKANNRLDFDDLLMLTVHLFEQNPGVLQHYQQKFQYIHVDEYQDTNHAQYKIVRMLAAGHRNVCVVGDSDQSIYSWRGADISNILSFEEDYEEAVVIKLEQNYRSTQNILDAANDIIANNPAQYEKRLFSEISGDAKVKVHQAGTGEAEVAYVAKEIKKLVSSGSSYENIALLYRMNSQSRLFEQSFMRENIPYRLVGGLSFFKRKEIKDLIAFLRLVLDSRDDFSFERIINVPTRGIGTTTIEKITSAAASMGMPYFDAIPIVAQSLNKGTAGKLLTFYDLILNLRAQLNSYDMKDFIEQVMIETGYLASIQAEETIEAMSRIDNMEEFKSMAVSFEKEQLSEALAREEIEVSIEEMATSQKLEILLTDIALQTDVTEEDTNSEKVTLMTVHAAKGLEFNTVFIVGFEDGLFPTYSAIEDGDELLQEERRLAYVAVTRAERRLYITNARSRMHQGKTMYHKVSRFQQEIDATRLDIENNFQTSYATSKTGSFFGNSRPAPKKPVPKVTTLNLGAAPLFHTGDKITHEKLGDGVVVGTAGDTVTIAFGAEHGIKKLKAAHPALKLKT